MSSYPPRKPAHGQRPAPAPRPARFGAPQRPPARPVGRPQGSAGNGVGWDPVANWYDKLVGDEGSDYHKHVILPAALRLLDVKPSDRVLDLCCGQGVLARLLLDKGLNTFVGVDASPTLIEAARQRTPHPRARFLIADAAKPGAWADGSFDVAACIMAVHDLAAIDKLFANLAIALKPGGRAVIVMMHPCFRIPRQSHWGWDEATKVQYRRLDRYGQPLDIPIATHPGRGTAQHTVFHHRPLGTYLTEIGNAGLGVIGCEELYSHRRSQAGGTRSKGEHRAAEEFPLFMALTVRKLSTPA